MEDNNGLINSLPDHILVEILSQLPLKTAVATAVLSRRWRWLWTHITDVDINVTNYPNNNGSINRLPDHILVEILSQLPLKTAIATAVLSRRWRWLWTHITDVDIDVTNYPANAAIVNCPPSVVIKQLSFVNDNVLPKLTSLLFRSVSFHLHYDDDFPFVYHHDDNNNKDDQDFDDIVSWYDWAWRHRNCLQKLCVIRDRDGPGPSPDTPLWIFQISSLVVLELDPWQIRDYYDEDSDDDDEYPNLSFHFPNLKKICVRFHSDRIWILEKLVSSSPCLEIFSCTIQWLINKDVKLSSRNLKQLEMHLSEPTHVVIDAPKLEYLNFDADENYGQITNKISFVNSTSALFSCSIWPWTDYHGNEIFLPSNHCDVISGVRSLTAVICNPTPLITSITFRCLTHLQLHVLESMRLSELGGLYLLQQCPVLEVLSFDLSRYYNSIRRQWSLPECAPQCLVTRVKRIEILAHGYVAEFEVILFQLLNYLLCNAKALELLKVTITVPFLASYDEIRFVKQLFEVPRTSSQSRVEFYSPNHTVLDDAGLIMLDNIIDELTNKENEEAWRKDMLCKFENLISESKGSKEARVIMDTIYTEALARLHNIIEHESSIQNGDCKKL